MSRIIGVVSGKGGVGKTTVTANLGLALTIQGMKVTLVDCNVTTSHLGFLFGIYYYDKTLNDVLRDLARMDEATYDYHGLQIIPASLSLDSLVDLDLNKLHESMKQVKSDIVLLDAAPGLGKEAMSVLQASSEIIFVTTPYLNAVTDVIRMNKVTESLGLKSLGIILNMVKGLPHELKKKEVERLTGIEVMGEVPYDEAINYALSVGKPLLDFYSSAPSSLAFKMLAAKITGVEYVPERAGLLSRIKSGLERFVARKHLVNVKKIV
jgi:septum site-determining protein MinD